MFDLNQKIKKARKEAVGLSALAILTTGALYLTTLEEVEGVSASDQETIHTVKSGDTLWRISVDNHVSLDNLKSTNGLVGDLIHPGDKLSIPNTKESVKTSSANQSNRVYGNELTPEQYETLLMVVQQESGGRDYNATLAVMSVITNRVDTSWYQDSVWGVITAPGQFEAYGAGHYLRHQGQVTDITKQAVADALSGKKNVNVLNFWSDWYYYEQGRYDEEAINIGGNIFFNL